MQYLGQIDNRWSGKTLGGGPLSIGQAGCYLTGFTNIARIAGAAVDPAGVNDTFLSNNRFAIDGNGNVTDLLMDKSLNGLFGCEYVGTRWYTGIAADLNWPEDPLSEQYAIEIWIQGNSNRTHFVVYHSGHTADDFKIVDSWDGAVVLLKDRYGDPATIIQKFVHYRIPALVAAAPAPTPEPAPAPAPAPVVAEVTPAPEQTSPVEPIESVPAPEAPAEPTPQPEPAPAPQTPTGQTTADVLPVRHGLGIAVPLKVNGTAVLADGTLGAEVYDYVKKEPIEMMRNGEVITFVAYVSVGDENYFQNQSLVDENASYGINGLDLAYIEQGDEASPQVAKIEGTARNLGSGLKKATAILDKFANKKKGTN